jgi:hypothetical protein
VETVGVVLEVDREALLVVELFLELELHHLRLASQRQLLPLMIKQVLITL